jgi:hypothetical protein
VAKFYPARGWAPPDPVSQRLRDELPARDCVVAGTTLQGHAFDAIVVGPQGLHECHGRDWHGKFTLSPQGAWQACMPSSALLVLPDPAAEELAVALCEWQLTACQRAAEPFIFRTGVHAMWTVQSAVQHMERHPADGVYHLHNCTLARWLRAQGAEKLAG